MTLPSLPKKEPRPVAVTLRLSKLTAGRLKVLANNHNMSQADVIEYLIKQEWDDGVKKRKLSED